MSSDLQPLSRGERIELLDILRGLALIGILLVNFVGEPTTGVDRAVSTALETMVRGSFYPLFSFLFGLGFAVQLLRARERGAGVAGIYLRRMLALLLIGTAHSVLVWRGDILVNYALMGLLLIPLHRVSVRPLAALIGLLLVFQIHSNKVEAALAEGRGTTPAELHAAELTEAVQEEGRLRDRGIRERTTGGAPSYADDVADRWQDYVWRLAGYTDPLGIAGDNYLLFFLVGLLVGKKGWLGEAERHRKGLAVTAAVGIALAVPAAILQQLDVPLGDLGEELAWRAEDFGAAALYLATVAILVTSGGRAARRLRVLAPVGMMALTNYLMQSLVMTWLFLSYGVGLTRPSTTGWALLNIAFFGVVQVPLSHWWMKRFRFGPMEWVWRCMIYGELQPLRRGKNTETPPPTLAPTPAVTG